MLCKQPFQKIRSGIVNPIQVKGDQYLKDVTPFACGQCLHCRINQSRIWQTRLLIEANYSEDSTFMTLTYDDDNVPVDYHLNKTDLTLFLKRYRKRLGHKIRYFAIGEYGDQTWRPHYHLAIFSEKKIERCIRNCEDQRKRGFCTNDCIPALAWNKGNISVTPTLNMELAGYITGYIKKKATKERLINRPNEFQTSSRGRRKDGNGGIGYRGIREIATQLKNDPRSARTIIHSIGIGGRSRIIGGYLKEILSSELGHDKHAILDQFNDYALDNIRKYNKNGMMIPSILEESLGKRISQEDKNNLKRRKPRI